MVLDENGKIVYSDYRRHFADIRETLKGLLEDAFKETGDIFNQDVARAYRREILSRVNEFDAMTLYTNFRGSMPSTAPFLEDKGLE